MIPIEKLLAVKTIITHAECPDGMASAMILRDVLPQAKIVFMKHRTPEHINLPVEPGTLFCDFPPHEDSAEAHRRAGTIVLDHHRGAKNLTLSFGENGVFADEVDDPGVSGAVLAYREVWKPITEHLADECLSFLTVEEKATVEHFATVAGVRDTWQNKSPLWRESVAQAEALRFYPEDRWLDSAHATNPNIFGLGFRDRLSLGEILLERNEASTKKTIAGAFRFTVDRAPRPSLRVACFQGTHTSDVAEALAKEVDLVIGWATFVECPEDIIGWDSGAATARGPKVALSCRSRDTFNAMEFAQSFGGNGHNKAAGFSLHLSPKDLNMYSFVRELVENYCRQKDL